MYGEATVSESAIYELLHPALLLLVLFFIALGRLLVDKCSVLLTVNIIRADEYPFILASLPIAFLL